MISTSRIKIFFSLLFLATCLRADDGIAKVLTFVGIDISGDYYYQNSSQAYTALGIAAFTASSPISYSGPPIFHLYRRIKKEKSEIYELAGAVEVAKFSSAMILVYEVISNTDPRQKKLKFDALDTDWSKFSDGHYRICNRTSVPIGVKVEKAQFLVPVNGSQDAPTQNLKEASISVFAEIDGVLTSIVKNMLFFHPKQRNTALVVESDSSYFFFTDESSGKKVSGSKYHLVLIQEDAPSSVASVKK